MWLFGFLSVTNITCVPNCFRMAAREVTGVMDLRKAELQYELQIRGADTSGSAADMAQRLREVLEQPAVPPKVQATEVSEVVFLIQSALAELASVVGVFEVSEPSRSQIYRVRSRVLHYVNRLEDLRSVKGLEAFDKSICPLRDQANSLQERIQVLLGKVPEVACSERYASETGGSDLTGLGRGESISEVFAKLPNPLIGLLREGGVLSVRSSKDIEGTLQFLLDLQDHGEVLGLRDWQYYQLLVPMVSGRLEHVLKEAKETRLPFAEFRKLICSRFLSSRMRQELVNKLYLEVQRSGELLEDYVCRVKRGARCLSLADSEEEIVNNILEGMCPEDRMRVIFSSRPSSFVQLEQLLTDVLAIKEADTKRVSGVKTSVEWERGKRLSPTYKKGGKCYVCNCAGHLARDCPNKLRGANR